MKCFLKVFLHVFLLWEIVVYDPIDKVCEHYHGNQRNVPDKAPHLLYMELHASTKFVTHTKNDFTIAMEKHPHFSGVFCYTKGRSKAYLAPLQMTRFKTKCIPLGLTDQLGKLPAGS